MDVLPWVKTFLAWFPDRYKLTIALIIMSGAALFLPASLQRSMGTNIWTHDHRLIEWGVFLLFLLLLVLAGVEVAAKRIAESHRIRSRMRALSADEHDLIYSITTGNINTAIAWPYEPRVVNLFAAHILTRDPEGLTNGQFAYSLAPKARRHLKKMKVGNPR